MDLTGISNILRSLAESICLQHESKKNLYGRELIKRTTHTHTHTHTQVNYPVYNEEAMKTTNSYRSMTADLLQ
jgi:hypothetical protein